MAMNTMKEWQGPLSPLLVRSSSARRWRRQLARFDLKCKERLLELGMISLPQSAHLEATMTKLPEAVIEAAFAHRDYSQDLSADRARRVILALAENLPESAVREALIAGNLNDDEYTAMRAAIIAALKDIVEGK